MKLFPRQLLFGFGAVLLVAAWGQARAIAQDGSYSDARQLVQRVQDDLRHVKHEDVGNHKQEDHVEGALKHLSDFDRGLSNNRFDKDRLDAAIDHIRKVVDDNTIDAKTRDTLNEDIDSLRQLKELRGNM